MNTKVINPSVSLSPETLLNELMWPAARYCIGRHTYVSDYANTFAKIIRDNRDKFYADRLQFFARDIRSNISHAVSCHRNVTVDGDSNDRIRMDAYTLVARWLEGNPDKRFCDYDFTVDCYRETVEADLRESPLMSYEGSEFPAMLYSCDLPTWIKLANLIDESTHVLVTTEWNGKVETRTCIPFPEADQLYDEKRHVTTGYSYRTAYVSLERIGCALHIEPSCIIGVRPLHAASEQ